MILKVIYTDDALRDLQNIFDYISSILIEPRTAAKQTNRIMDAADSLGNMPFRYRLYDNEPWHSRGLRILPIDNFLVLYLPDEMKNTVAIIRIIYGGRDIDMQLNKPDT